MNYQLLSTVAQNLKSSEAELLEMERHNWIQSVARNGSVFLAGRDAYKARFILHLRRLGVTPDEIGRVLEAQTPPYSLSEIPKLLGRPIALK